MYVDMYRSALQCLIRARDMANQNLYIIEGLTHTWMSYYVSRINSAQAHINEWHAIDDFEAHRLQSSASIE